MVHLVGSGIQARCSEAALLRCRMPTAYMHANDIGDAAAGLELVASLDTMSVGEGGT